MTYTSGTHLVFYLYGLFIVGAITLMVTALSTTYWVINTAGSKDVSHGGLFSICTMNDTCFNLDDLKKMMDIDIVKPSRGLTITATIMDAFSLVLMGYLALGLRMKVKDKKLGWIGMVVCIIASILAGSGVAHFLVKVGLPPLFEFLSWRFGYSMYLAILSSAASFAAGISFLGAVYQLWRKDNPIMQPHSVVQGGPAVPVTYVYPNNQNHPNMAGNYEQPPPMYTVAVPTHPAYPYQQQPPAGTYPAGLPPPMVDQSPYPLPSEKS